MTPSVGPISPFSEHTCSQDGGVGSCHQTEFSVVTSVVHHWRECEQQSMLIFLFISRFCCVFVCTRVSILASCWRFEFCTFKNTPINSGISLLTTSFWKLIQGCLFAFPAGLLVVTFGVPFAPPSSLPFFHHLSNFGAVKLLEKVNEVVPSLCLSCLVHA